LVIGAPYPFGDWMGPSAPDSPVALTAARDATGWLAERGGPDLVAGGASERVSASDVPVVVGWYEFELATVAGAASETTGVEERAESVGRGRAALWSGLGAGGRCGVRRTFAVATRATWIRPRSNRKTLETPPLNTAAKLSFDLPAGCGAPPEPR